MRGCTHLNPSLPANITLLTALPSCLQCVSRVFLLLCHYFFIRKQCQTLKNGIPKQCWQHEWLESAERERRGKQHKSFLGRSEVFHQRSFNQKNFIMCSILKSWAACKCALQRDRNVCSPLRNPKIWNIWEFHCQTPTLHAGLGDYVSCFHICNISTFPQNMQVLLSHTGAPKHFQVFLNDSAWNILFFSLLAVGQIHTCRHSNLFSSLHSICPSACNYHWGTTRQLLLGCHIENKMH